MTGEGYNGYSCYDERKLPGDAGIWWHYGWWIYNILYWSRVGSINCQLNSVVLSYPRGSPLSRKNIANMGWVWCIAIFLNIELVHLHLSQRNITMGYNGPFTNIHHIFTIYSPYIHHIFTIYTHFIIIFPFLPSNLMLAMAMLGRGRICQIPLFAL